MSVYEKILHREQNLSVIGLGYVGMPIAVSFSDKVNVIGFDVNEKKITQYKKGIDPTGEVGNDAIKLCSVEFTSEEKMLQKSLFHIVAVPTPVNEDHTPDLSPVISASHVVGRNLKPGAIVVYESTVYPGVTEEICLPILEKESGLKCGKDFKIGYSPERINPGDKVHRLESITKIVSGIDKAALEEIANIYSLVVQAGVYKAESIKVAEAAKVIENSQRDINIAFMNELSIIFHKMGIDTKAVLNAAGTKWNFLEFYPGLVGGHCIGVDPYYLAYKAEQLGYHSQVIMSGRRINDDMGKYIAEMTVKTMIQNNTSIHDARVGVLGFTFKENCPDARNTKVYDIVKELNEYGIHPYIADPVADVNEVKTIYHIDLASQESMKNLDVLVVAVAHEEFKQLSLEQLKAFYSDNNKILIDVKGVYNKQQAEEYGYKYWRL